MTTSLAPHPLLIPPDLAKEISLHEAVILQQMHYWLERSNHLINGCLWIYNTYQAWQQQFPFLSLSAIRKAIARLERLKLLKTERFDKQRWNQTKWYSINYQRLEVLISSICSNRTDPYAQIGQLDVANLSSLSTEITAFTTSENTSPRSEEREEEKPARNAIMPKSCTSSVAKDELASKEQTNFALDLRSAPASRIQNEFDESLRSDAPAQLPDSSTSAQTVAAQQANCLPQFAPTTKPSKHQNDCTDELAMCKPSFESPTRTQLLTKLSALTTESIDTLRLNTILASTLDRYRDRANDALEYFHQASATWKNKPGIGLFIHAVKSGQKPSLTKPGGGWKEWADEAMKRRLMEYLHSQDGDIIVYFVGGGQGLWSQLRSLSWSEIELIASRGLE